LVRNPVEQKVPRAQAATLAAHTIRKSRKIQTWGQKKTRSPPKTIRIVRHSLKKKSAVADVAGDPLCREKGKLRLLRGKQ